MIAEALSKLVLTARIAVDQPALSIQTNLCDSSNKHELLNQHQCAHTEMYMSDKSTFSCMV